MSIARINITNGLKLWDTVMGIVEHLQKSRASVIKVNQWPMMEVSGGAQAVQPKVDIELVQGARSCLIQVPNLLGAFVLKPAAYCSDNRDRQRHLDEELRTKGMLTLKILAGL